jgi:aryl-alcohol dehydrogenase-like predicted oxidoreductase
MTIERRSLGTSGMTVSVLGVGCSTLGAFWQGHSDADWKHALETAISHGINLFDTADSYGRGRSESLLGKVLKGRQDDLIVITKTGLLKTPSSALRVVGAAYDSSRGAIGERIRRTYTVAGRELARRRCVMPQYVARAVAASQRRLLRSQLDIFLLHSPPPAELQNPELIDTLNELRQSGAIRTWGVSARATEDAAVALEMPGIGCLEIELNICNGDETAGLISTAAENGVAIIARQPFGSGSLLKHATRDGDEPSLQTSSPPADIQPILQACLQYPLSLQGVGAVVAGMARPEHVLQNEALMRADPASSATIDSIRELLCGGRRDVD